MSTKTAALVFGIVFAVVGFLGFMPSPPPPDAPPLAFEHGHGLALGMFPVNTLHNVVHLLFAVLGSPPGPAAGRASYFQFLAVAYGLLAVLGLIPGTQHDLRPHPDLGQRRLAARAVAGVSAYFGFVRGNVDITHHTPAHGRGR